MRYNKMKLAVGLFILTLFISIFSFLFVLLDEKGTFDKRYNYHFRTDSAEYLYIGMPLKFSGFVIGVIDEIKLQDDGSVFITFSVNEDNRKWISEGSMLMIIKPLLGSPYIVFNSSLGSKLLKNDSTLEMIMNDDINDLVTRLKPAIEQTINILNNVNTITSYLAKEDSEFMMIIKNLNKLTTKLANDDSLLTSATGSKKATKDVIESLKQTAQILKNIEKMTSSLDEKIISPASSSIKELELIMKDIKHKLDTIDGTVNSVGSYDNELIELKEQIIVTIQKSNQILDKVDSIMADESSSEVVLP